MANAWTPKRPVRPHPTDPTAALVELTRGYWAIIDAADAPEVGKYNWSSKICSDRLIYAIRSHRVNGQLARVWLHRFIGTFMGLSLENDVDHENCNGLDCRRRNLRDATRSQNLQNSRIFRTNTSGVKGATWNPRLSKWEAKFISGGVTYYVGVFADIEDARTAIHVKRVELQGTFANAGAKEQLQ
jgi:hypothetical protein